MRAGADARLDVRPVLRSVRSNWTWRHTVIALLAVGYLALTLAVLFRSPVTRLDHSIALGLRGQWPRWRNDVHTYVILGQRGPTTMLALPLAAWVARRERSWRPVITLLTALTLLNLSVGAVKVATGRLGPRVTRHAHEIFAGGDIFPSGHVSNAVVVYGVLAMLAVRHRKALIAVAVWISLTVGLGTLYLGTHWLSDVIGGWLAGALVLLVLPYCVPVAERWCAIAVARIRASWRRRRADRLPVAQRRAPVQRRVAARVPVESAARIDARLRAARAAQAAARARVGAGRRSF